MQATSERGQVQLRTEARVAIGVGQGWACVRLSASVLARPHSFFHVFKRGTKEKESAFSKSRFSFLYYLTRRHNKGTGETAGGGEWWRAGKEEVRPTTPKPPQPRQNFISNKYPCISDHASRKCQIKFEDFHITVRIMDATRTKCRV